MICTPMAAWPARCTATLVARWTTPRSQAKSMSIPDNWSALRATSRTTACWARSSNTRAWMAKVVRPCWTCVIKISRTPASGNRIPLKRPSTCGVKTMPTQPCGNWHKTSPTKRAWRSSPPDCWIWVCLCPPSIRCVPLLITRAPMACLGIT